MYEITMPKLSDSMEEGKIIAWKVKEGDRVRAGDVLAEIESDKATMELECFHDGILKKIVHGDNSEVAVGEVIGYVEAEGGSTPEEVEAKAARAPQEAAEEPRKPETEEGVKPWSPSTRPACLPARQAGKPSAPPAACPPDVGGRVNPPPAGKPWARLPPAPAGGRAPISPYARKLAREKGVDVGALKGTGPGGRITGRDVEAASGKPAPTEARPQAAGAPARPSADEELPPIEVTTEEADVEEASFRQKTQARRVVASKHVIPHFYITRGIDVTRLLDRKDELKQKYGATITHLVMLACLKALDLHPEVNRSYDRGKIIKWKAVNLGLAVDTQEGLTVVVLRDAGKLALKEIVERTKFLVEKARSGKLSAEERRHPTFTISTLGMHDVEQFEPIIAPPSAVTLAVASALESAVVRDGQLRVGKVMKLTLSCDHRIIDGVTAAKFLAELKRFLENDEELVRGQ